MPVVLAVWSVLVVHGSLFAQSPPPDPPPPPPPHEGTAEFSFVGTSGNAESEALGVGGEYIVRNAPWLFRGKVAYVRNESDNELSAESFTGLLRTERKLKERISAFGEYGYLHDLFAGIESRNTINGGVTLAVVRPKPHQLDVDLGIGYAHENRTVGETLSTAQGLLGARYKWEFSENANISDDVAFSFSFSDANDWRMANTIALTAKMTSVFALKVSNNIRYVNAPVQGFETTDSITSIALVAKF